MIPINNVMGDNTLEYFAENSLLIDLKKIINPKQYSMITNVNFRFIKIFKTSL